MVVLGTDRSLGEGNGAIGGGKVGSMAAEGVGGGVRELAGDGDGDCWVEWGSETPIDRAT